MRVTQSFLAIFSMAILISCKSKNEEIIPQKQWTKIEIAGEHAPVYSIYGNINSSLLVSLYGKILNTKDGGTTWTKKLDVSADFGDMKLMGDTLVAISNFEDYYSLDGGETWQLLGHDIPVVHTSQVTTSNGVTYRVKENFNGELGLPSDLIESCKSGGAETNIFPYQHGIYYIYLDQRNGLYVGVNNTAVWNPVSGSFEEHLENNTAFYYSKN